MTASHQATVDHPPESRRPTAEAATPVYPAAAAEMRSGGAYAHSTLALDAAAQTNHHPACSA
jgi:hypothetical protein